MTRKSISGAAIAAMLVASPSAFAQTGGAAAQGRAAVPEVDMQLMMRQCAEMRGHVMADNTMNADMQALMRHCNQVDPQPAGTPATPPAHAH